MRRILAIMAVAMLMSGATMAGIIDGSAHDLSSGGPGAVYSTDEICVFCHTPHQPTAQTQEPLWNHTLSSEASYGIYTSDTMDALAVEVVGSGTTSVLCMSCHDGTVAVGSMYNFPGAAAPTITAGGGVSAGGMITSSANVGTSLSNDHPVNFTYADSVAADGTDLNDPPGTAVLFSGKVQCASCHDVHDNDNGAFLIMSNADSALCTDCHAK